MQPLDLMEKSTAICVLGLLILSLIIIALLSVARLCPHAILFYMLSAKWIIALDKISNLL